MKFKKIAATVLAAAVLAATPVTVKLFSPFSVTASAMDTLTEGDYIYTVNEDGETVRIITYFGDDTEVTVPETLGGKTVTRISSIPGRYGPSIIKSVTIPDSVTTIDDGAFNSSHYFLETITVGENNANFSSIDGVLFSKDETRLISYPGGKGGSYDIPDGVTTIGQEAFKDCLSLMSVTIPDSVTNIVGAPFGYCSGLNSIDVDADNANYCSEDGVLFNKDKSAIIEYPAGIISTNYTIPDGVTTIGGRAFRGCKSLTSVTIPNSVTSIEHWAFEGCDSLTSVTIPNSVTYIKENPFNYCSSLTSINVDADNANYCSEDGVLFNKDKTEIIAYPEGKNSTSYTIPDSVTTIGWRALKGCDSLTSVTLQNGVTTIGHCAFEECFSLTSVTIPKTLTTVDLSVFATCSKLTTVYYGGTKAEWAAIEIGEFNDFLKNAKIICTDGVINDPDASDPTSSNTSSSTSSDTSSTTSSDTSEPTSSNTSTPTSSNTSESTSSDTSTTSGSDNDFHKENEVSAEVEASSKPVGVSDDDRITSITINPAFNMKNKNGDDVELDLSKISIKASEIYDEEGLKRAEEALGETLNGNTHYNLLDLTLLYDGEDFSNGYEGLVKVIIPLPNGHRDKNFSCFRLTEVNGKMEKQIIPGEQTEDSYIIYLEHFSLYALVADPNPNDSGESSDISESEPQTSEPTTSKPNPNTGIGYSIIPILMAAGAVVAASAMKKKK